MNTPYESTFEKYIKMRINRNHLIDNNGISIITCTNKLDSLNVIINNFNRQIYSPKELIIIINNNKIALSAWKNKVQLNNNIKIFKLDENISLGKCLNFAIERCKYPTIARFDDDDYYGPKYLSNSIKYFDIANTKLIGKQTIYVYFTKEKILAIKDINHEEQFVYFLNGATMLLKKEIFKEVRFRDISINEDVLFCKDCIKKGLKPYSGNKNDFVYIRQPNVNSHTWKISNTNLLNLYCKEIGIIDDFKTYVDI